MRWNSSVHSSLLIELSTPGTSPASSLLSVRSPRKRRISTSEWTRASAWRTAGSPRRSRSRATASRRCSTAPRRSATSVASSPRSKARSWLATCQPSFTAPTTWSAGVRASVKKTSLNSWPPAMFTIGRISMPGWSIGHEQEGDPPVLRRLGVGAGEHEAPVGGVGFAGPDLLAVDDPLVAVEGGPGGQRGEVGAGVGLGVALAPAVLPREDAGQVVALLLLGARDDQGRSDHVDRHHVVGPAGRRAGSGELLVQHDPLDGRQARAAVVGGPGRCDQPVLAEQPPPADDEVGPLRSGQSAEAGPVRREVLAEEGPNLGAVRLGLGRVGDLHGCGPPSGAARGGGQGARQRTGDGGVRGRPAGGPVSASIRPSGGGLKRHSLPDRE